MSNTPANIQQFTCVVSDETFRAMRLLFTLASTEKTLSPDLRASGRTALEHLAPQQFVSYGELVAFNELFPYFPFTDPDAANEVVDRLREAHDMEEDAHAE